jgi:hypothetical protein
MARFDYVVADELSALANGTTLNTANIGSVTGLTLTVSTAGTATITKLSGTPDKIRTTHGTTGVSRVDNQRTAGSSSMMGVLLHTVLPTTNPSADSRIIEFMNNSSVFMLRVNHLSSGGNLRVYNAANTSIFTTGPDISGEVYIWCAVDPGATTALGKVRFEVYDSTFTLIGSTTLSVDTTDVTIVDPRTVRVMRVNSATDTGNLDTIAWSISDSQITALPPLASSDAGSDQTDIEPGATVTLTGTGTGPWAQDLSGGHSTDPVVTLSGGSGDPVRSFTAPYTNAGVTLQFTFGGDPMTVEVLRATRRYVTVGGATPTEVPLRREWII